MFLTVKCIFTHFQITVNTYHTGMFCELKGPFILLFIKCSEYATSDGD